MEKISFVDGYFGNIKSVQLSVQENISVITVKFKKWYKFREIFEFSSKEEAEKTFILLENKMNSTSTLSDLIK